MAARFFLAIDGGATGTRARLRAEGAGGAVLGEAEATAGPSSLTLGVVDAWAAIGAAFEAARAELAARAGAAPDDWADLDAAAGLAGVGAAENREAFFRQAPPLRSLILVSDGATSVLGAHGGRPGCVVALGTGTVGHALYSDGTGRQVGGWGFPAGDEGGGAWIGRAAIAEALRARDERRIAPGSLAAAVWERCGPDPSAILTWLKGAPSTRYAQLAPLVVALGEAGDAAARDILAAAGREAARLAELLSPDRALPLALLGGLAAALTPYLPEAARDWATPPEGNSLDGAMLLARGRATAPAEAA